MGHNVTLETPRGEPGDPSPCRAVGRVEVGAALATVIAIRERGYLCMLLLSAGPGLWRASSLEL